MNSFMRQSLGIVVATLGLIFLPEVASPQAFISGSTGADGAFNPACGSVPCTFTVDLKQKTSGIFNYTTVNIPSGVTVNFTRNLSNAPVTMLATGDVTIAGTIDVRGSNAQGGIPGRGGPGGFDGGLGGADLGVPSNGSPGLGPGGGEGGRLNTGIYPGYGAGGGFSAPGASNGPVLGGPSYGTHTLFPLIGGSGGGGGISLTAFSGPGGGGGGGGILIASTGTISLIDGVISADGGLDSYFSDGTNGVYSGCGSGGGNSSGC